MSGASAYKPIDFQNNEALNMVFQNLLSDPLIARPGKVYYNIVKQVPYYATDTEWIPMAGRPVQREYTTEALFLAAQSVHLKNYIYHRIDQGIYYEYLGTTLGTMADYRPIGGSGTLYTHPAKTWVDKTALSGATVISNLTIDSLGHPTDWVTRVLTASDIGAVSSSQISGTLNYVAKFTPDGNSLGNSQIFDNGTGVGIGTTTISQRLNINGNIALVAPGYLFSNTGNIIAGQDAGGNYLFAGTNSASTPENLFIGRMNTTTIFQTDGGIERMRIISGGNIGIGLTNPIATLHVAGNATPLGPATSGSSPFVGLRVGRFGFAVALDMGTQPNNSPTYSWIQSRDQTDFSQSRLLALQPNGGNVTIGLASGASSNTLDVNGTTRIRTRANGGTTFAKFDALGVLTERTAAEVLIDIDAASSSHNHTLDSLSNVIITTPATNQVLQFNGTNWVNATIAESGGTVTSVAVSGGTTGLTVTGSPITTSGTITLTGTLIVGNGGTGATSLTGVIIGTGTTAMTAVAGTASQLFRRNAGNTAYEFFTHDFINQAGARTAISLTTTGTSGVATYSSATGVLNIPNYSYTYTHPAKTWVDKTTLSGAVVISNLIIDALGHPTNWTTRSLTPADISAEPAFVKGSIIQGAAMSVTGTLTSRLVGTGDITVAHADTSTQADVTTTNGVIIRTLSFDTYGHVIGATTANLDDRWVRRQNLLDSTSTFLYTSETGSFPGVDVGHISTGSTGFPTVLGQYAAFGGHQTNSVSFYSRVFALFRSYDTENYYLGSANDDGTTNPWRLIYHSGNLSLATLGGTPSTRNITINGVTQDLSADRTWTIDGTSYQRDVFTYVATNIFTLTESPVGGLEVYINGQKKRFGVDYTVSGTTLTIVLAQVDLPSYASAEIEAVYYYSLAGITAAPFTGSGTTNFITRWLGTNQFGVSLIQDTGSLVTLPVATDIPAIAATTDTDKFVVLDVNRFKYRTGAQLLSDIGAQAAGSYANAVHTHIIGDVTGLQVALDGKQPTGNYSVVGHNHIIGDITGLQTALDGKQATGNYSLVGHVHAISDITALQTSLDAKVPTSRTLTINGTAFDLTSNRTWTIDTGFDAVYDNVNSGAFTLTNGLTQKIVLNGNKTFTFASPASGKRYEILIHQDTTGGRTVTWPELHWRDRQVPMVSTAANAKDKLVLTYDGTLYWAELLKNYGVASDLIIQTNLLFWLDPANTSSYSGSGSAWNDLTANGLGATLVGPTFDSVDSSGVFDFDGTDDRATMSATVANSFVNQASYTVGIWVKPDTTPPSQQTVWGINQSESNQSKLQVRINSNGSVRLGYFANDLDSSASVITFGSWNYLVVQYNSATDLSKIYVNGSEVASSSVGGLLAGTNRVVEFGRFNGVEYLKGSIGAVHAYTDAKTPAQILENFNALKGRYGL